MSDSKSAVVMAGISAVNNAYFRQIRFSVGDPSSLIRFDHGEKLLIVRDIEMGRARKHALVDRVACPADYSPSDGLSGDRETATAQAVAECLVQSQVEHVTADRTMPLIYADEIRRRGLEVTCDLDLGVVDRRQKDEQEIGWLAAAQQVTEQAVELACRMIAGASANSAGELMVDGSVLTSERVRTAIDVFLLEQGYAGTTWIVAGGIDGADCHHVGSGTLRTNQPVIVDIFPQNRQTRYHGDCTRTVVHGDVPDRVQDMFDTVVAAKQAAVDATRAGVTGEQVHQATIRVITERGYQMGLPPKGAANDFCSMAHGTGHGIGLDVHEPILLDFGGPPLLEGEVVTIEPGLYHLQLGGIRVEDMVVVTSDGTHNFNKLPETLDWT